MNNEPGICITSYVISDMNPNVFLVLGNNVGKSHAIQSALRTHGILYGHPRWNLTIKHPVTGLECVLRVGDTIAYNSATGEYVVSQTCKPVPDMAKWGEIRFTIRHDLPAGTLLNETVISPDTVGSSGQTIAIESISNVLELEIRYKHGENDILVKKFPIPKYPRNSITVDNKDVVEYLGHAFAVWREPMDICLNYSQTINCEVLTGTFTCTITAK